MDKKKTYSAAEKKAYYKGFGAGEMGLTVKSPEVQKHVMSYKDEKCQLSAIRGILDGNAKRNKWRKR